MLSSLRALVGAGMATQKGLFPDLPEGANGLPKVTEQQCLGERCQLCAVACPTQAIALGRPAGGDGAVSLDRGLCIGCSGCMETCPTGTLARDLSTRTAVSRREDLVLSNQKTLLRRAAPPMSSEFRRSLHVREVSTGCNATDLEVQATTNPIFDVARFGVHLVASPRFADALLVTGPVGRGMREALIRCHRAMGAPRLVLAVGTCAVSGGLHRGGYAEAEGVGAVLQPDVFVPGCPPHPWSIMHGLLLAMDRVEAVAAGTATGKEPERSRGKGT